MRTPERQAVGRRLGLCNYVILDHPCWSCGNTIKVWQTKDGTVRELSLEVVPVEIVAEIHDRCSRCGEWNWYLAKRPWTWPDDYVRVV
ncbi:hypothetical protein [Candidatus Palauibacter sp.]|uniref:hypothetical protein n=1 Tax=Candidatus Palauibacter sp. TaxID=3101350 RepID=UPI003CC5A51A